MITKKDLLEAIEDMPMDAKICIISPETDVVYIAEAVNVSIKYFNIMICILKKHFYKYKITPKIPDIKINKIGENDLFLNL